MWLSTLWHSSWQEKEIAFNKVLVNDSMSISYGFIKLFRENLPFHEDITGFGIKFAQLKLILDVVTRKSVTEYLQTVKATLDIFQSINKYR